MKSEIKRKIGLRIKELRLAKKIKQCDLADMLNMERSNLTRIESGKQKPSDENIEKLAKVLGVEVKEFFETDHLKSKSELIDVIIEMLQNLDENKLQYTYKMIKNLFELK